MVKLTRRHLATLSGALVTAWGVPTALLLAAPQAAPPEPADLLSQRKADIARASDALRAFDLKTSDEPMFRLVVR